MIANARSPSHVKVLKRFKQAISTALLVFDWRSQKIAACEEMAELAHLLLRDANDKKIRKEAVQEEIADCYICLRQMQAIYFKDQDEFFKVLSKKLSKLEGKFAAKNKVRGKQKCKEA